MNPDEIPGQDDYTEVVVENIAEDGIVVSNLGVSSWTLSAVEDRERNFYMKGAMGTTTSVALGLAISRDEEVTVLDGDGSLLMSLGVLSTVSRQAPDNLTIVVMNNSSFATTGGQPTLAAELDFSEIASSAGLNGYNTSSIEEFSQYYLEALDTEGTTLINCNMQTTTPENYPEPDYAHSFLKNRFKSSLSDESTKE